MLPELLVAQEMQTIQVLLVAHLYEEDVEGAPRTVGDELAIILYGFKKSFELCLFRRNFKVRDDIYLKWETEKWPMLLVPRKQWTRIS